MNRLSVTAVAVAAVASMGVLCGPAFAEDTNLKLARFFGVCDDPNIPLKDAAGESCIVQSIIRDFSLADNGITVSELPADWGNYYDAIKTMIVGGNPPDVIVLHRSRLPELAAIGALAEITPEDYAEAGIVFGDFQPNAVEGISYGGKQYAVPFDFHAYLWHVNMGIMKEAGLVTEDHAPVLPTTPEELLAQARQVKEATGADYLTALFGQGGTVMRVVTTLMMQQGIEPFDAESSNFDTPAGRNALSLLDTLSKEKLTDVTLPTESFRGHFYGGNSAILIDGTWRVNATDELIGKEGVAIEDYYVASFPTVFSTPAAWADSHMWAIPSSVKKDKPEAFKAAMKLLAFLYEHDIDWARTGHLPVSKSVLASDAYKALSHRSEYSSTAEIAHYLGSSTKNGAIQDDIGKNLVEFFLNGKSTDDTLVEIDESVNDNL